MANPAPPPSILIRSADAILSGLPAPGARLDGPDLRIENGLVAGVGALDPRPGEETVDASGCVVYPAWVCTHHHLFQSVLKAVPGALDASLGEWLAAVTWPLGARIDEAGLEAAALLGLAEAALGGTATVADHQLVADPGARGESADILFEAAERVGVRLVYGRGFMTVPLDGGSQSSRFSAETADGVAADVARLAATFHDPGPHARRRIALALVTPLRRVGADEMAQLAEAARGLGLRLHTHLSEDRGYVDWVVEATGRRPVEFCADAGWLGPDVWFAHLCHLDRSEVDLLAGSGTGMAHCPGSNCRLGSGIAPAPALAARGVTVSLGIDGAASNEGADMGSEARLALYLHRAAGGAGAVGAEQVVHWGTGGGGRVLGLETGVLAPGQAGDVAVYDLDEPRYFGFHDRALAPVLGGGRPRLRRLLCGGRTVVDDGVVAGLDLRDLGDRVERAVRRIVH